MREEIKRLILEGKTDEEIIRIVMSKEEIDYESFYDEWRDYTVSILRDIVNLNWKEYFGTDNRSINEDIVNYINQNYVIYLFYEDEDNKFIKEETYVKLSQYNEMFGIVDLVDGRLIHEESYSDFDIDIDEILNIIGIPDSYNKFNQWFKQNIYSYFENKEINEKILFDYLKNQYSNKIKQAFEKYYFNLIKKFAEEYINSISSENIEFKRR